MRFRSSVLVFAAAGVAAWAAEPAPTFKVGDSWTYAYSQDGDKRWDYVEQVVAIRGNVVDLLTTDSLGRQTLVTYDGVAHKYLVRHAYLRVDPPAGGFVLGQKLSDFSAVDPPIRFPIDETASWTVDHGHRKLTGRVVGREKIVVPAGEFDTLKIELFGITRALGFTGGRYFETYWYSPKVGRFVRRELRQYGDSLQKMSAATLSLRVDELLEYRAGDGVAPTAVPESLRPKPSATEMPAEFTAGTTRFVGSFVSDPVSRTYTGEGRVAWANGDVYEGRIVKGAREGRGTFVWADGQRYEGEWSGDAPNGHGRIDFTNGDRYEGDVEAGAPSGRGILVYASGSRHVGRFENGVPNGPGRFRSPDGQTLDGDWRAGKAFGPAFIEYANGDRYEGDVEQDRPHGQGKLLYASGDVYAGRFAAGRPDGDGSYAWKSGDRYEGAWKDGRKHGRGRLSWANGDRWEGVFVDDARSDDGVLTRRSP